MFNYVAVALASSAAAFAAPLFNTTNVARGCGSHISTEQMIAAEARFQSRLSQSNNLLSTSSIADATLAPIPVHWHVIHGAETLEEGYLPDSQVTGSIDAMNEHFAGTGLSFTLASTNRVANAEWFKNVGPDDQNQTDMKNQLRVGDAATLNIYSVGFEGGSGAGLLGYATFPEWYEGAPKDDGVVILYSSVPGGSTPNYNEGKTLTHEVGHWIGLYHVFQGGCTGSGDFVSDTPPQRTATNGCPTGQDSCTGGGVDSVHNYMDYSYDPCMFEWTPGQLTRAKTQISTFRGIEIPGTPSSSSAPPTSSTSSAPVTSSTSTKSSSASSSVPTPPSSSSSSKPPTSSSTTTKGNGCPWWWPECPWAGWF